MALRDFFLPPNLPLVLAAASPAFVLSLIRFLSNSANAAKMLIHRQNGSPPARQDIIEAVGEEKLLESIADLNEFKYLEERGYADLLISHYPSLRKYFADFIQLPFESEEGSEDLTEAIKIVKTNSRRQTREMLRFKWFFKQSFRRNRNISHECFL